MTRRTRVLLTLALLLPSASASAQAPPAEKHDEAAPCKQWFLEGLGGSYSSTSLGPGAPTFNYAPIALRLGYRPFEGKGTWFSRCSVMIEGLGAPIYDGFGDALGGPSALFRMDFRDKDACLIPYIQVGTGIVFTDAYQDMRQRAIGQATEFLQQAQGGVRWKVREGLALIAEGGIQHISNAGIAERNGGINAVGGSLGVSWTLGSK